MAFAEQSGTLLPTFNLHDNRFLRPIAIAVAALGLSASVGCLPEQVSQAYEICADSPDVNGCVVGLGRLYAIKTKVENINEHMAPTDGQLAALAECESGGNYQIVNSTGTYMGAFQYDQRTWNGAAVSAGIPEFVGIRPNTAKPEDQRAMARITYSQRGSAPWPVCGRNLP